MNATATEQKPVARAYEAWLASPDSRECNIGDAFYAGWNARQKQLDTLRGLAIALVRLVAGNNKAAQARVLLDGLRED